MSLLPVPSSQYPEVSASIGFAITPSDSAMLPRATLKLYVGIAGDLACVLNNQPIAPVPEILNPATAGSAGTLSAGDLTYTFNGTGSNATAISKDTMSSGKWYSETTLTNPVETFGGSAGAGLACVGITVPSVIANSILGWSQGGSGTGHGVGISPDFSGGNVPGVYVNRDGTNDYFNATPVLATGDVIGVALDLTMGANTVSFYHNGTLIYTENLTANGLGGLTWNFGVSVSGSTHYGACATNFGATAYAETPPTGFGNLAGAPVAATTTFKNCPVGFHDLSVAKVLATGTAAGDIVGLV